MWWLLVGIFIGNVTHNISNWWVSFVVTSLLVVLGFAIEWIAIGLWRWLRQYRIVREGQDAI